MSSPLPDDALQAALAELPDWTGDRNGISRTYTFSDFPSAISYMHGLVDAIEADNHHPEWSNVYNRISVNLRTHDADNKVTDKDICLAKLLDEHFN